MPEFLLKISPSFVAVEGEENFFMLSRLPQYYSLQIVLNSGKILLEIHEDLIAKA